MNHTANSSLITVDGLSKRFGDRQILSDVSLRLDPGETVAMIGPSGGGKSTLLRCINALAPFDAGWVRVGPHQLLPGPAARESQAEIRQMRRLVGLVFQDYQLFPHWTAEENVAAGPRWVLGWDRGRALELARELLGQVGLSSRLCDYASQLSGGQRQRVAIARALALSPRALLCDEITSALDPELKQEVLSVLSDLRRDGLALLMVTHEIRFSRRVADRVIVLAEGRVIEEGPPSRVLDHPQHPRAQSFLAEVLRD